MECGAKLELVCPSCSTPYAPGQKFCAECGTALGAAAAPRTPAPAAPRRVPNSALPEERRWVTVLFADISGYTAMAERMDAELVKSMVDRCLRRLGSEVERFGGIVDKYIGDNVMAIFGAPVAHEDDAERAIRAALAMHAAITEMDPELSLRVGINTGEVLAGAVGQDYTVVGDTVNVAARLQSAARPTNGACVCPALWRRGVAASRPTASKAGTGSDLPFSFSGSSSRYSTALPVARIVRSPTVIEPISAADCSRAATFTVSPITV